MNNGSHGALHTAAPSAGPSSPTVIDSAATTLLASPTSSRHSTERGSSDSYRRGLGQSSKEEDAWDAEEQYGEDERLLAHEGADAGTRTDALPVEDEERPTGARALHKTSKDKPGPVAWSSLPRKDQLAILTLARLSEPLTQTSLQSYMFYQLRSFSPEAPDSTISYQAGLLQAAFTGAQFVTAIAWGRCADSERVGRKMVILIGLLGTGIGAVGFGFSSSFAAALAWRAIGGTLNGNIGVMRTMISEIIREKKFQSRAFLLLPICFNLGVIIGPIIGGLLADPITSYPALFGKDTVFGGADGVWWMKRWPYALPNLVSAVFLFLSATTVLLGLEESHWALRHKPDMGLRVGRWISRTILRRGDTHAYRPLPDPSTAGNTTSDADIEMHSQPKPPPAKPRRKLPFRRLFTLNLVVVLLAHGILSCHVGTFNNLWFVFLSTPRYIPASATNGTDENTSLHLPPNYHQHPPFTFTGGLALPPPSIGTALAILGVIGISLQLLLYPKLSYRLGTPKSYRLSLLLFPLAYTLAPFLSVIPTSRLPPAPASGPLFWLYLVLVLAIQVLARTFALPAAAILVNNASPHPSVLGTVHGIGQSVSSAMRTLGPVVGGLVYGKGLAMGMVGLAWWGMAAWAVGGAFAGLWVRDGDGHEIWLEGEKEEEEEEAEAERERGLKREGEREDEGPLGKG